MMTSTTNDFNAGTLAATPVHMLVDDACIRSGLTNQAVAKALGYPKGNVIAMMCSGDMKIPVNKVEPLARVLELDPADLLRRVLTEYTPDTWAVLNSLFGHDGSISTMTTNEKALLAFVRNRLGGRDVNILEDEQLKAFLEQGIDSMVDAAQRGDLTAHIETRKVSGNAAYNQAMKELIKRQAAERESLRGLLGQRPE